MVIMELQAVHVVDSSTLLHTGSPSRLAIVTEEMLKHTLANSLTTLLDNVNSFGNGEKPQFLR